MEHRKPPLQRVVRLEEREVGRSWVRIPITVLHEVLACGHTQRVKTDIYGQTTAYRRRCKPCAGAFAREEAG